MCFSGSSPAFAKKNRKTKGRPDYLSFLDANCDNTYQSDCQLDEKGWRKDLTMLSHHQKKVPFLRILGSECWIFSLPLLQAPDLSVEGTLTSLPLPQVTQVRTQSSRSPRCWDPPRPIMSHLVFDQVSIVLKSSRRANL